MNKVNGSPQFTSEKDIEPATAVYSVRRQAEGNEVDDAQKFIDTQGGVVTFSEASNKALLRRIDLFLMPLMCFTFVLQYMDKTALGYAAVYGIQKDLSLTSQQYSMLSSLLYIGFILGDFPGSYIAQILPVGRMLGVALTLWGLIVMSTALCTNYSGIAAQRFFLGLIESATTPIFVMVNGMWYTRAEQNMRLAWWASMNGIGQAIGGFLSLGFGKVAYKGIPSWKWLFIFEGAITVLWGFLVFFIFPSSPATARFLSDEQKVQAIERIRGNNTGIINKKIKPQQILECFKDPQVYLLFFIQIMCAIAGGIATFKNLIVKNLGFNDAETSAIGAAVGFAQFFLMLGYGYMAMHWKNWRLWSMFWALPPTILGCIWQATLGNTRPLNNLKLFGVLIMESYFATGQLGIGLPAQNAAGFTRRNTTTCMVFLGYGVGLCIGPQAFYAGQHPQYLTGMCVACVTLALAGVAILVLRWWYIKENKRREKIQAQMEADGIELPDPDMITDETERHNPRFRYVY